MATDPTISLQAGRPPSGTEAGGGILQQPNLLSNPSQLNALMTMGGNLAAGRALQQAITPDGQFSPETFAQILKNDPQAAYAALPAMEKGLATGKAQLDLAAAQRQKMQGALSSLLLDPKFREDPNYANKQYDNQLVDLTKQGLLSPQRAANEAQMKPMGADGKLDVPATVQRLEEHLYNTLPPDQQKNLQYGEIVMMDRGDSFIPMRKNQRDGIDFSAPILKGLSPESQIAPQPTTPTPGGAPQTIPGGARAGQLGVPVAPPVPGVSLPNPLSTKPSSGALPTTGRYEPSPGMAKFIAATAAKNYDLAHQIYQQLSDPDKAKLQSYISAKQPK